MRPGRWLRGWCVTQAWRSTWEADLALNLTSVFYSLKYQVPLLQASGGGAIVNNASNLDEARFITGAALAIDGGMTAA